MKTSQDIIRLLKESSPEIREKFSVEPVALFGSYARGEASSSSDLDMLYRVIDNERFGLAEIHGLEQYLRKLANVESVDLINEKYLNPIIELEIQDELIYV